MTMLDRDLKTAIAPLVLLQVLALAGPALSEKAPPGSQTDGWYEAAAAAKAAGDSDRAAALYRRIIGADPSAKAHASLAEILVSQNKLPKAYEQFRKATRLDPEGKATIVRFANVLCWSKDPGLEQEAFLLLDKLSTGTVNQAGSLFGIRQSLFQLGLTTLLSRLVPQLSIEVLYLPLQAGSFVDHGPKLG